jgi:hypothetical protein
MNAQADVQLETIDSLGNWLKYELYDLDYEGLKVIFIT